MAVSTSKSTSRSFVYRQTGIQFHSGITKSTSWFVYRQTGIQFHSGISTLWNSLPLSVKLAGNIITFPRQLKTHLFKLAYPPHVQIQWYAHAHKHACHTHMHTHINEDTYKTTHIYRVIHACMHAFMHASTHTCKHSRTHTCKHARLHTLGQFEC